MADSLTWVTAPLIYATCGCLPTTTSNKKQELVSSVGTTVAGSQVKWSSHPWIPGCTIAVTPVMTQHGSIDDNIIASCIYGNPAEIECVPLEVPETTDLSALTGVHVHLEGY